ncbi:hypothetical protein [Caldimonas brevitalea]|uniref:DUF2007 domain-containing protein n=1 Tax=Caldimonas brevitalea TaxID=413882 RepID=A0A0G3BVE0_9BURK|nr:hypothetical protein [Caldimonas brevitalea]AKJ30505.1 hypothetical protein AAW51_3814 [Caldimonas brevitalea]
MIKLTQAPNIVVATLWADQLSRAGLDASVQRQYASGIAGEIPLDQSLPEVWLHDPLRLAEAQQLLRELQRPRERRWRCPQCDELVEGPFEQCWNCGANMPGA